MVEFALVSPLLFLMLFGVMEGGWLLFHNHQVSNAAREGARFAVVNGAMSGTLATEATVTVAIEERVVLANPDSLQVVLDPEDPAMEPGSTLTVEVDYTHQTLVGFIFPSASINLSSSSTMMVHY
ncbi:MAG: TadE family protein [Thermomicrobiaceae bacterium]